MSIYAYLRVSTEAQTLQNQEYEIALWSKRSQTPIDHWIRESVSGTIAWEKRKLGSTIRRMKRGDTLVSSELSRLGRNMLMVMSILNTCAQKGISIITIKDNYHLGDSINSKIIAFAFALSSEIERNLISQRTKEALAARKLAGQRLGRPPGPSAKVRKLLSEQEKVIEALRGGESKAQIAKNYGIHRNTFAKCIKRLSDCKNIPQNTCDL